MALRRSKRLANIAPEIKETTFQCFFCYREDFTCRVNVIRMPCCSAFCHSPCNENWVQSQKKFCGRCRTPFSNDEQQQENAEEQEEENVEEEHLEAPPPLIATGQDLQVSRQQLLTLLSNEQGIQEVLLYKPLGQTETVGEFFGVASSADFKQKLSHLFHLLRGFTMDKIFVLIRFQNPRTFRFYFSHLKRLLFPFFTILQTILTGEDHGSLNRQCIFTLSTNGNRCVSYELTKHGRQYNIGQPEWPIVVYSPYSV